MKSIALLISVISFNVFSLEPNCSRVGTRLIHIPGELTRSSEQNEALNTLKNLKEMDNKLFDYRIQFVEILPIQSQGYLQAKFNYLFNTLGENGDYAWFFLGKLEQGYSTTQAVSTLNTSGSVIQSYVSSKSVGVLGNV